MAEIITALAILAVAVFLITSAADGLVAGGIVGMVSEIVQGVAFCGALILAGLILAFLAIVAVEALKQLAKAMKKGKR